METRCPRKCGVDIFDAADAYDLMDKHGILPVAGGALDQTEAFVSIIPTIRRLVQSYTPQT